MKKYIFIIICIIGALLGCSPNRVDVSNISTRAQLDSIIALLPQDSVKVDSLPHRTLNILLQGNFLLHGLPVNNVYFVLYKEELAEMSANFNSGCLTILNNLEQTYGLGSYMGSSFSWQTLEKGITLEPRANSYWSSIEAVNVRDTIGGRYSEVFYNPVRNKITDIAKDIKQSDEFLIYSISLSTPLSMNYKIYINGFPVVNSTSQDSDTDINEYLVRNSEQTITVEFLPPFDYIDDLKRYSDHLPVLNVYQRNKNGAKKKLLSKFPILANDIDSKKIATFKQALIDLPYAFDYADYQDLRQIPDIKDKIYTCYNNLKIAMEAKDENKVAEMLYSGIKIWAVSNNVKEADIQLKWRYLSDLLNDNEGVELRAKDDLNVVFYNNGRVARLVSKPTMEYPYALFVYNVSDDVDDYSYPVCINKAGVMSLMPQCSY